MVRSKAWQINETKSPPRLNEIFLADPGLDEALVRITATGLNFADLLMIDGTYQDTPPLPFVPGMELAGVIEAVGDGVENMKPGDRIMAVPGSGALAEHIVVPARSLRPIPPGMEDSIAAGFQLAYGTSHLALTRRAALQPGETLVVLGAAGGVGLTAVEIGHQLGARVVAVARGTEKLEVAKRAGADFLIDSGSADLREALKALGQIDVIYDAVGGEAGDAALRALAPEGRFLVIGFACGQLPVLKANHLLVKNQTVIGFYWGGYARFNPEAVADSLTELARWHSEGRIRPHVSATLPFESALEGLELLRSRKATGKVVITR